MAKKTKNKTDKSAASNEASKEQTNGASSLLFGSKEAVIDSSLASLFANSAGPVKAPEIKPVLPLPPRASKQDLDEELPDAPNETDSEADENDEDNESEQELETEAQKPRKRKRGETDDALEELYMKKIAKEEEKEQKKREAHSKTKRRKTDEEISNGIASDDSDASEENEALEKEENSPPVHESLAGNAESSALEKSLRTVFLGNVSTEAIKSKSSKKALMAHLSSFFPSLPDSSTPPKIESIRFRSTAFSSTAVPKRASFAKKELMDGTTKSTNAYVVYTIEAAASKALSLNGTIVLDRHLRVDSIAHPSIIDHRRCIFVGNLGFMDEEPKPADEDETERKRPKKQAPPSDIEEGLWRTFNKHAGTVESVRVVRDPTTRVGKGFAYVQFQDQNGVEAALLLDGKIFPPMLPRKLRVVRAKRMGKKNAGGAQAGATSSGRRSDSRSNSNPNRMRLGGGGGTSSGVNARASRLFGRAGAAQLRSSAKDTGMRKGRGAHGAGTGAGTGSGAGERFVFEGHRATESKGVNGTGSKSKGKKSRGRPDTRRAQRAKAFKDAKKK